MLDNVNGFSGILGEFERVGEILGGGISCPQLADIKPD
jgi:hypothetical protein